MADKKKKYYSNHNPYDHFNYLDLSDRHDFI